MNEQRHDSPINGSMIDAIPFRLDLAGLMKRLRLKEGSPYLTELRRLRDEAESIARPKALYKVAFIDAKGDDNVVVDGIKLTSRVLRVNLENVHRVFPYVATCGVELDQWAHAQDDMLFQYWADVIKEMAMRVALQALDESITADYEPGKTAVMSPGSLADWPLPQQCPLFTLLGDVKGAIGVELTDSFLMIPNKSVSGIRFSTTDDFASCQLCPRENCPGRRASYDDTLYERKYRQG
ncbi:MAG TPA: vitamin B12 dependent-methionine synthase activation domain-containing protein [Anaerolineae bacterium]|nr:vitamin B12 dependent-methionine synthase activation domain-containing protein [Anaerolineae bacterium]HQH39719.1 vitamin B12 dependent-methionine synthase activation domain-containing protein [Anaerolineae bacterium]